MSRPPRKPEQPLLTFPLNMRTGLVSLIFTYAPVMNRLFHTAPINGESWLRIAGVAAMAFVAVEFEKWIRFGRHRGEHSVAEYNVAA